MVAEGAANNVKAERPGPDGQPRRQRSRDMSCHGEQGPALVEDMHSYQEKQVHHTHVLSVNMRLLDV